MIIFYLITILKIFKVILLFFIFYFSFFEIFEIAFFIYFGCLSECVPLTSIIWLRRLLKVIKAFLILLLCILVLPSTTPLSLFLLLIVRRRGVWRLLLNYLLFLLIIAISNTLLSNFLLDFLNHLIRVRELPEPIIIIFFYFFFFFVLTPAPLRLFLVALILFDISNRRIHIFLRYYISFWF
jgi:hypothetical protein